MTTWILVLYISYYSSATIATVPGFKTKEACEFSAAKFREAAGWSARAWCIEHGKDWS